MAASPRPRWQKRLLVVLLVASMVGTFVVPMQHRIALLLLYGVWGTCLILLFVLNLRDRAARQRRRGA